MVKTLDEIGRAAGTDKASHDHNYLDFYEINLQHLRNDDFFLFEIGVYKGNSLLTWANYFQDATVVGLDIDPAAKGVVTAPNAHVRIGDAGRLEVLDGIIAEFGAPLVVVDDGSHFWHHQIDALRYLWPRLLPGGIFIMEDIHTSFPALMPIYKQQSCSDLTSYEYLQKLNRWVVGNRHMAEEKPDDGFISSYWPTVDYMQWYRGTCLIHKKRSISDQRSGSRKSYFPRSVLKAGQKSQNIDNNGLRKRLFSRHDKRPKLGIGIVTYNRTACLIRSVDHVLKHTKYPYELVVADDGSTDGTAEALDLYSKNLAHLRCKNRGVNFNKNRLLYYFNNVSRCDIILILEDDSFPVADGWERKWMDATEKWGHINNAGAWFSERFFQGDGSLESPFLCKDVSAQCVGFAREAIEYVGFIDPELENYGGAHAEHSYRMVRAGYGGEFAIENETGSPTYYLINGDIMVTGEDSGYKGDDHEGLHKYFARRDGPIYRQAWRNDKEQEILWEELSTIT